MIFLKKKKKNQNLLVGEMKFGKIRIINLLKKYQNGIEIEEMLFRIY